MSRRKDGGSRKPIGKEFPVLECPGCGCPNRVTDTHCMYCRSELVTKEVSLGAVLSHYINSIRMAVGSEQVRQNAGALVTAALSIAMVIGGLFLFVYGIGRGGMASLAVGVLLLLYGVSALSNVYSSIRKS